MLMTFAVLLGIIFVVELAGGIAAYVERGKVEGYMEQNMVASLKNYANDTAAKGIWDNTQAKSLIKDGCCGVDGYQDWYKYGVAPLNETFKNVSEIVVVPRSCCIKSDETCDRSNQGSLEAGCPVNGDKSTCPIYTTGCRPVVSTLLMSSIAYIGGVGVGVAFIQIIGIVFACYLARRIRSGYSYN